MNYIKQYLFIFFLLNTPSFIFCSDRDEEIVFERKSYDGTRDDWFPILSVFKPYKERVYDSGIETLKKHGQHAGNNEYYQTSFYFKPGSDEDAPRRWAIVAQEIIKRKNERKCFKQAPFTTYGIIRNQEDKDALNSFIQATGKTPLDNIYVQSGWIFKYLSIKDDFTMTGSISMSDYELNKIHAQQLLKAVTQSRFKLSNEITCELETMAQESISVEDRLIAALLLSDQINADNVGLVSQEEDNI